MSESVDTRKQATLSEDDAKFDEMIRRASAPSLAELFQRGKDAGLIKPAKEYGGTSV